MLGRGLLFRQCSKKTKDIGIGFRHAKLLADSGKIMDRNGQRSVQIEYPATAGKNVIVASHNRRIAVFVCCSNNCDVSGRHGGRNKKTIDSLIW